MHSSQLLQGKSSEINYLFKNSEYHVWSIGIIGDLNLKMYIKKATDLINDVKCIQVKYRIFFTFLKTRQNQINQTVSISVSVCSKAAGSYF